MPQNYHLIFIACALCLLLHAPAFSQTAPAPESPTDSAITADITAQLERQESTHPLDVIIFTDADLWQRIRRGFVMNELNSPLVQQQEHWYASRPDYIQRFVDRGSKYLHHIVEEVEKRGMPMEVALLPIIESAFNPQAFSHAKASGMWQFIPSTGKMFGLKQNWMADNRRDVLLSTNAALDYLQKLYGMFNSWELAFAAYNCGEGCVGRAIAKNEKKGLATDYLNLALPNETRGYLPKLIAVKNIILSPGSYGIELVPVENRPYFAKVDAPERIDTSLAARLADMPESEFATLNPAFIRPVASSGTGYFLVPYDKAETFRANLELYRSLNGPMVSWQTVSAKRGESIDAIAKRYGMSGSYLRATNGALRERRGKLTQPATLMVPITDKVRIINATLDQNLALRPAQPVGDNAAPKALPPATLQRVNTPPPKPTSYTIRKGDSLYAIALKFDIELEDLMRENRLNAKSILRPGAKLRVNL